MWCTPVIGRVLRLEGHVRICAAGRSDLRAKRIVAFDVGQPHSGWTEGCEIAVRVFAEWGGGVVPFVR